MAKLFVGIEVTINGQVSDKEWTGLRLDLANSKHVAGYVTMRHYLGSKSRNSGRTFYRRRSRIQVLWGEFPNAGLSRTFYGYIDSHKAGPVKKDNNGNYINVSYYVVGTSHPMQVKHNWTGMSWSSAAKTIAKRHKMKAVVHQTPKLSKALIQHQSDFKFLVEGAEKTGFRFFVWGTTLYFVNPQKMLNAKPSGTPLFSGNAIHDIDVDASDGESNQYASVGTAANGSTVTVTSDNSQTEYWDEAPTAPASIIYDATVVESLAEAQQAVQARVLSDQQWVLADVETDGDARVIPGKVVYLVSDELAEEHKGLWIVNSVSHIVDISDTQRAKSYHLEMELSRDRLRSLGLPETDDDTWVDLEDVTEEVPWEASDEFLGESDEDEPSEVEGVWQADFYGDDDSQVEY